MNVDGNVNQEVNDNLKKFFVFPFIRNITKTIVFLIDKSEFTVEYRCLNNLRYLSRRTKKKLNLLPTTI